jgi:hypothetical protein
MKCVYCNSPLEYLIKMHNYSINGYWLVYYCNHCNELQYIAEELDDGRV